MKIPDHMGRCSVVGGLPVPVIVQMQRVGRTAIVPSTWAESTHMTVWVGESGPPNFGKYDDEMHRRCMAERWCHVCGCHTLYPLVCVPSHAQRRRVDGLEVELLIQPWVCPPCLAFACEHCPPLNRALSEGRGFVTCPLDFRLVSTWWQPASPEDPIPPPGAKVLCAYKLMVLRASTQTLADWWRGPGRKFR